MRATEELLVEIQRSYNGLVPLDEFFEHGVALCLAWELARNGHLYDQSRYDDLQLGLEEVFGWSRVQLNAKVREIQAIRSVSSFNTNIFEVVSDECKELLCELIVDHVLRDCRDSSFRTYIEEKCRVWFGVKT